MTHSSIRGYLLILAMMASGGCGDGEGHMTLIPSNSIVAQSGPSAAKFYAVRLAPGADPRLELQAYAKAQGIQAGAVVTAVGSLSRTVLRLADQKETTVFDGKREIVSLVGTVGVNGCHLHLTVSDGQGITFGGHLADGCVVNTTAEIVIADLTDLRFDRADDPRTGFRELIIQPRNSGD